MAEPARKGPNITSSLSVYSLYWKLALGMNPREGGHSPNGELLGHVRISVEPGTHEQTQSPCLTGG